MNLSDVKNAEIPTVKFDESTRQFLLRFGRMAASIRSCCVRSRKMLISDRVKAEIFLLAYTDLCALLL